MALKKAVFTGYRGGLRTQRNKQILVKIDRIDTRDKATKYIGRKVVWRNQKGNTLIGKITGVHGRNGVLKARFKKGLPGQAMGAELEVR
jgi:large subunit ribosomal protein L35Ae